MAEHLAHLQSSRLITFCAATRRYVFCTGPLAIVTAVIVAAAIVGFAMALVTPKTSAIFNGDPGYWAIDSRDDQAFVTAAAAHAYRNKSDMLNVFLVGNSLMRSAFGAPELTQEVIRRVAGRPVTVASLAAGGNTAMHMFALLEIASASQGGIAVIGLSELTLALSERERLMLIARAPIGLSAWEARNTARAKYGRRLNVDPFGTAHAWEFYRARWSKYYQNVRAGRRFTQDTQFAFEKRVGGVLPAVPVAQLRQRMARQLASLEENADDVLSEFSAMLAHFNRRADIRIVLMLDTLNPAPFEDHELAGALARARARIDA